jgi:[ribosomal protein S5]-alanine N-acetyltransferase
MPIGDERTAQLNSAGDRGMIGARSPQYVRRGRQTRLLALELVPYQSSFLEAFIAWRSEPLTVRHNPLQSMTSIEIAQMLESAGSDLSDLKKYGTYRWFVALDAAIVGSVSLKNISHSMGYAEIGYGIAEAHHRKGIATTAVRLLVDKVFAETPLRKLLAFVHDKNRPSCRVLERLGFRQEGFLREHYIINRNAENEILYCVLKHEWQGAKTTQNQSHTL